VRLLTRLARHALGPVRTTGQRVRGRYQQWDDARRLRPFRNRHAGQRAFVIGNGPSLSVEDLERLGREVTFAANKVYLLFPRTSWRPGYYVASDSHFLQQNHDEVRRWRGFPKLINARWRHLFPPDPEVLFYPFHYPEGAEFPSFSRDVTRVVYCGETVTFISLQLAHYMGCSPVYLLGVDFRYATTAPGGGTIVHAPEHGSDHFARDYFRPGELRWPPQLDLHGRALECARSAYEADGRPIWNATRGGALEIFPRISLEAALDGPRG
jgi:hypothetical protein